MTPYRKPHRLRRSGMSASQLLLVLAVLLILVGLLIPAIQRIREAASHAQSMNNLKQMALGMHAFHDSFKGFPPAAGEMNQRTGTAHYFILPFIEQAALYNQANEGPWGNEAWSHRIAIYVDPRDNSMPSTDIFEGWLATTSYPVNWLVTGDGAQRMSLVQITDGTSNTLMFAQRYQMCNGAPTAWGYPGQYTWAPMFAFYNLLPFQVSPAQADCDPERPQAIASVMLVAMCDGSARAVNPQVSAVTWASVCGPNDGNAIGPDF